MILRSVLITVLVVGQVVYCQDKPATATNDPEAVVIPVKTLSGDAFTRLAKMLGVFNVKMVADDQLRVIVAYAPPPVIAQMRKVVEALDRPGSEAALGRNIEMTMTFLRCSMSAQPEAHATPPELAAAVRQLRMATQCKSIEVWDAVPLRLQEGKETSQDLVLPSRGLSIPSVETGRIFLRPAGVTRKDSGRFVKFDSMQISFNLVYITNPEKHNWQAQSVSLHTAGDFKEGQKTILGKLSSAEQETATFVVIDIKVLD